MSSTSDFYLARAGDCARDAAEARLDNVRERYLRSEAAWRAMANQLQRAERMRTEREAEKQAGEILVEEPMVSTAEA